MKIKKLKIVVTFESEKLARMLEIRKVYLGMPESKFLGIRKFPLLEFDDAYSNPFSRAKIHYFCTNETAADSCGPVLSQQPPEARFTNDLNPSDFIS